MKTYFHQWHNVYSGNHTLRPTERDTKKNVSRILLAVKTTTTKQFLDVCKIVTESVYKSLFQYRHLLKGAPVLSVDLANMSDSQIAENFVPLENELSAVIHYLMGLRGVSFSVSVMLEAVNKHYKKDDFLDLIYKNKHYF